MEFNIIINSDQEIEILSLQRENLQKNNTTYRHDVKILNNNNIVRFGHCTVQDTELY